MFIFSKCCSSMKVVTDVKIGYSIITLKENTCRITEHLQLEEATEVV